MGEYDRRPDTNDPRRRPRRRSEGEDGTARRHAGSSRRTASARPSSESTVRARISPDHVVSRRPASARSASARSASGRPAPSRRPVPGDASPNRTAQPRTGSTRRANAPSRQRDVYVGAAPKRRGSRPLAFVAAGIAVVALVALGVFAVPRLMSALAPAPGGSQNGDAQQDSATANMAVSDQPAEPVSFTVTFAGDCTLGTDESFSPATSFNARYDAEGDPSYFFRNVYDLFSSDDLTVVNMEGTLTESTTRQDKTFAFKGSADYAQVLVAGDVEAASLANNHSRDYGEQSYTDTKDALDAAGIVSFGYDDIAYMDVKGVKVALVGTYELAEGVGIKDSMVANIQRARDEGAQVVMVYIHWGIERETVPNQTQMTLGHAAIDAGADLVIGSHPHVIQGYEKYQGRYIVYSLGNFCFGGNSNPSDKDCMIFQQTFTVTNGEVEQNDEINVIPCSISSTSSSNNYQPTPAEGSEAERINAKIQESTDGIAAMAENF